MLFYCIVLFIRHRDPKARNMAFVLHLNNYLEEMEVKHYNFSATRAWAERMTPYVVCATAAYVGLAFLGVHLMKDRQKFDLRRLLVMWNAALGWFSFVVALRLTPFVGHWIVTGNWTKIICSLDTFEADHAGLWSFLFTASKLVEFGDTVFIVLKKKKLIFLHWYHHITVCLYCWLGFANPTSLGKVFGLLNSYVHAVMYTYYAISASGLWRIPRQINVFITTMQLTQMLVGIVVTVAALYNYMYYTCGVTENQLWTAFAMYGSYTILFMNFFYQTYIARKKPVAK